MKLEVKNLSFSYGSKPILKDISLEVKEGEFVALMGPNGSGKTTLLRCLTRYLPTESRTILVDMKPLHTLSDREVAKTFAVVPQSSATDFQFTSHDVVMMGRIPHIESRLSGENKHDEEVARRALERTGASGFARRPFSELSGGERQRVIIARALAQEPRALLLDEPTVYLDVSGQFDMMDLIKRLNKEEGITIVAVLHDINLAARYSDRIALLSEGRLEAFGTPEDVLTPEMIQSVYGVEVAVRRDPFSRSVFVMPRRSRVVARRHGTRVHVLCGGGTGGPVMKVLVEHGYAVSAGVVNVLDSDYENAKDLRVPVVAEVPFSQIGEEAHSDNLKLVDESVAVVLSPFPVGPGNFRNLEAARYALDGGKKILVLKPEKCPDIDFVGGRADAFIKNLITSGAVRVLGAEELVSQIPKAGS
jgi:iron complex transport system ATP-binding protein